MFTRKNDGKGSQLNKKPVKNYCMSNISCLHHGDRLKAAVHCFHRTFIVNSLYIQKSEIALLLSMFTHTRNLTWRQELPVQKKVLT